MKKLALLVSTILLFGSCSRMIVPMGALPEKKPKPFVKLKTGTRIEPKNLATKSRSIRADGKTYKKNDIAFYSDGRDTYGSIKRASFATQIYVGDINVYQTISTSTSVSSTGHMHTHTHVKHYLQKEGTDKLTYFRYKSLTKLIPSTDLAFKYLKTFKRNQLIDNFGMLGGFGMFCGGTVVAGKATMSTSGKGLGAGFGIMLAGVGAICTGYVMNAINHLNLKRAVAAHNGLIVK